MRHNGTASIPAISDSRVCVHVRPGDTPVCVCVCVILPADGNWDAAGLHQFSSVGELKTKWGRGHLKCYKTRVFVGAW